MPLVQKTLTIGNYVFTGVALIVAIGALYAWYRAISAWGNAGLFADAMVWTIFTVLAFAVVITVEWAQNRGA